MKKLLIVAVLFLTAFATQAQTKDNPFRINLDLTNNKLNYREFDGMFDFGNLENSGFRLGVQRYLNSSLDLELGVVYGKLVYENLFRNNIL